MYESKNTEEIRQEIQKHLKESSDHFSNEYEEADEALRFEGGDQWPTSYKNSRANNDRPMMVKNFTKTIIQRVVNPFIKYPFGIKVNTTNNEVGELLNDRIRQIEQESGASEVYENAFHNAVTCGYGYIGVFTDYINDTSLEQEPYIGLIKNPLSVFLDPFAENVDGSDAKWGFFVDYVNKEEAKKEYGRDEKTYDYKVESPIANVDLYQYFTTPEGSIPKITYYKLNTDRKRRVWFNDGSYSDDKDEIALKELQGLREVGARYITTKYVKVYTYVGQHLANYTELPISYIPIIPCHGDTVFKEDNRIGYAGIVRRVKDSQMMVNFYASNESELVALAPKAPYIAYGNQLEGYEKEWSKANVDNSPVLRVNAKATGAGGSPLPLPQRASNRAETQHLIASGIQAQEDMSRESGIFDTTFAKDQAGDQSGRALLIQKGMGELSTVNYTDNLRKSIKQAGRVLVELILKTPAGISKFRDKDGAVTAQSVNFGAFKLNAEDFDLNVSSGPMYESERDEFKDKILSMYQVDPQKMGVLADLLLSGAESPEAKEAERRLKLSLPPEMREQDENAPDPQAIQALESAEMAINELKQENEFLINVINQYQQKEIDDSKDRAADLAKEEMSNTADLAKEEMKQFNENYRAELKLNGELTKEEMKQEGANQRETAKIVSDTQKDMRNIVNDAMKNATVSEVSIEKVTNLPNKTKGLPEGAKPTLETTSFKGDSPTDSGQEKLS